MIPTILVCGSLAEAGLEVLREAGEVIIRTDLDDQQLQEAVAEVDAVVVRSATQVTAAVIESAPKLRVIARAGVGVDNIDLAAATRCGVLVVNSPVGNTLAAAEHTIALMLAAARRIPQAASSLKAGKWDRKAHTGRQLFDKTLGIVGLGKVGAEVAKRALAFDMKVIAYDPYVSPEQAKAAGVTLFDSLEDLAAQADYLSLHCTLTSETERMVNDRLLGMMKPEAVLVNTARGGLVDEAALAQALRDGTIDAAALDVFAREPTDNTELLQLPNLIATPHVGASTEEAQTGVAMDAARQVADVLSGRMPRWPVNAPPLSAEAQAAVEPYLGLVRSLGVLGRSLMSGSPRRIELAAVADLAREHMDYLAGELVVAVLRGIVDGTLNFINAATVARERGIELAQAKIQQTGGYSNLLQVRINTSADELLIAGALLDGSGIRIVRLDAYRLELLPRQTAVLIWNAQSGRPGFIGKLGSVLGAAGINITGMQVAPEIVAGIGLMAVTVADPIAEPVREQIVQLPGVQRVAIVDLSTHCS